MGSSTGNGWLFGIVIGALTSILAGIPLESYRRHRDCKSAAAVLAAEIDAILNITTWAKTVENYEKLLPILDAGQNIPFPAVYTEQPEYSPIFEKHIDRLGLLPPNVAGQLVQFHTYLIGIKSIIKNLMDGVWDKYPNPAAVKAQQIRFGIDAWREATKIAEKLVKDLREIAK